MFAVTRAPRPGDIMMFEHRAFDVHETRTHRVRYIYSKRGSCLASCPANIHANVGKRAHERPRKLSKRAKGFAGPACQLRAYAISFPSS